MPLASGEGGVEPVALRPQAALAFELVQLDTLLLCSLQLRERLRMPSLAFQIGVEPLALRAPVDVELLQLEPLPLKRSFRLFGRLQPVVALRMPLGAAFHLGEPAPHFGPVLAQVSQGPSFVLGKHANLFSCFLRFQQSVVTRMPLPTLAIGVKPRALRRQIALQFGQLGALGLRSLQLLERLRMPFLPARISAEPRALRSPVDVVLRELAPLLRKFAFLLSLGRLQLGVPLRVPLASPGAERVEPTPHNAPILAQVSQLLPLTRDELRLLQRVVAPSMPLPTLAIGVKPRALRRQIALQFGQLGALGLRALQLRERFRISFLSGRISFEPLALGAPVVAHSI